MAARSEQRFYVPPPPEDPLFSASQFQSQVAPQNILQNKVGAHFAWPSRDDFTPYEEGHTREGAHTVPETPINWSGERQHAIPDTESLHLRYSYGDLPARNAGVSAVDVQLKSVMELPEKYRQIFSFPYFNIMQSKVFDKVLYTDLPLVVSAPTGSGKTVVFELAILRLLIQLNDRVSSAKIVYVAPIKALCSERCEEWRERFRPLGLECTELTGDTEMDDFFELQKANIITTTPEKWDSMTRRWKDNTSLIQLVRLFLVDEVHQLNDPQRGPTVEAIVSRMKTVQSSLVQVQVQDRGTHSLPPAIRFLAVSATMPNISDVAAWLGTEEDPAIEYNIDESHRPVHLRKVVLGYPDSSSGSMFKFDCSLNYKLSSVIHTYSEDKPTLVFCATRKGTQQAASVLLKDARFVTNVQHKQALLQTANSLRDSKLRDVVTHGVGYHHAGLDTADRKMVEATFLSGQLPVLFCTSTLAMGVNLPAHLVVVKSTQQYANNGFCEYSETQILQMIGRAGRPQFDTSATAVIMTRHSTKHKYESLMNGSQLIESSLHTHLIEHLNAEVVLGTITDVSIALEWLKSTFLYVRIKKNPKHYGIPAQLSPTQLEDQLQQLCLKDLSLLDQHGLIALEDAYQVKPTIKGKLMAQYCVAFESAVKFAAVKGTEQISSMLELLVSCKEFEDVRLRVTEKRVLNTLNADKNRQTVRFPMSGKIKSTDMKVNCLIQAALGMLPLQDFSLNQDTQKIFRLATRLSKCLMEMQYQESSSLRSLLGAVLLCKCLRAKLWENSKHVAKQIDKIGVMFSTALVNAGMTSFNKLSAANPRELELILNKHPPFGTQLRDAVSRLPHYSLSVVQLDGGEPRKAQAQCSVTVQLTNCLQLKQGGVVFNGHQGVVVVVGDQSNAVLFKQKIMDNSLLGSEGVVTRSFSVNRSPKGDGLELSLIHTDYVGLDCQQAFTPVYSVRPEAYRPARPPSSAPSGGGRGPQPHSGGTAALAPPPPYAGAVTGPSVPQEIADQFSIGFEEYMYDDGMSPGPSPVRLPVKGPLKTCNHRCSNKLRCGHECCKVGISSNDWMGHQTATDNRKQSTGRKQLDGGRKKLEGGRKQDFRGGMGSYLAQLHAKTEEMPQTPMKRLKVSTSTPGTQSFGTSFLSSTPIAERFSFKRKEAPKLQATSSSSFFPQHSPSPQLQPAHHRQPPPPGSREGGREEGFNASELEVFDDFDDDDHLFPMLDQETGGASVEDSGLGASMELSQSCTEAQPVCRGKPVLSTPSGYSGRTGGHKADRKMLTPHRSDFRSQFASIGTMSAPIQPSHTSPPVPAVSAERFATTSSRVQSCSTARMLQRSPVFGTSPDGGSVQRGSLHPGSLVPSFKSPAHPPPPPRVYLTGMDPTTGQPSARGQYNPYKSMGSRDALCTAPPLPAPEPPSKEDQYTSFFTQGTDHNLLPDSQLNSADFFDGIL